MYPHKHREGFTLVEVIFTVALVGLLIIPIITGMYGLYYTLAYNNRQAAVGLEFQSMFQKVTEDLRAASGLGNSNAISDPNKSGGWTTSSDDHILVIRTPALDDSNNFIYNPSTGEPYQNEIVYYNDGKNFYRHTLPNTAASGNSMTRSCPPPEATSTCPADTIMSTKFDTSSFTFYDSSNSETANASEAESVTISIGFKDSVRSQPIVVTNSIRITFRNT